MIIYTESDYLEAHLTGISSDPGSRSVSAHAVPQFVTDVLKKFTSATPNSTASSPARPSKSRNR